MNPIVYGIWCTVFSIYIISYIIYWMTDILFLSKHSIWNDGDHWRSLIMRIWSLSIKSLELALNVKFNVGSDQSGWSEDLSAQCTFSLKVDHWLASIDRTTRSKIVGNPQSYVWSLFLDHESKLESNVEPSILLSGSN